MKSIESFGERKKRSRSRSKINLFARERGDTSIQFASYLAGDECGEVSSGEALVFVHAFDDVERCGDFRPLRGHGAVVEASQAVDFQSVQGFLEER